MSFIIMALCFFAWLGSALKDGGKSNKNFFSLAPQDFEWAVVIPPAPLIKIEPLPVVVRALLLC